MPASDLPMIDFPVINISEVLERPDLVHARDRRGVFEAKLGLIGKALDTRQIGINLTIVPPRSKAFPRHYHFINDELFIVIEGAGRLHFGEGQRPLGPWDVVYIRGGTGIPFQIENDSDAGLRYLALSSMSPADVFVYPDGGKMGIMANGVPFRDLSADGLGRLMKFIPAETEAGYYDREPEA